MRTPTPTPASPPVATPTVAPAPVPPLPALPPAPVSPSTALASPTAHPGEVRAERPDNGPGSRTFNRDLSWLEFNRRVLHQSIDERTPLLERVRFLAIFSSNLDEFVMKRLRWLKGRAEPGHAEPAPPDRPFDQIPPRVLLDAVRDRIRELQNLQAACFEESVRPALAKEGVHLLEYSALEPAERQAIDAWFRWNVFPILTPLAVDPGHRFPFISNLSENLGVLVTEAGRHEPMFARVKVPSVVAQWVPVPRVKDGAGTGGTGGGVGAGAGGGAGVGGSAGPVPTSGVAPPAGIPLPGTPPTYRFVHLSDVIRNNLDDLFPGMKILGVSPFRVTRNAEVEGGDEDDADNILDLVETQLKRRRFARAVRLEAPPSIPPKIMGPILEELGLEADDLYRRPGPLDYGDLTEIADLPRPDLKHPPWTAVAPPRLADTKTDIFALIREGDILVHHPYESFTASAERFIAEAGRDPAVLAIKQTIYRTSRDSPFISSMIRAAEAGKQVAALVELRARFDEQSNVRFAQMLEKAGVHVAYGVVGLKTHCKASLVVRKEADAAGGETLRAYAHIGTGNYHPKTAQLYTDLGLLTCDPEITGDVVDLFNLLTGRSLKDEYGALLVAPTTMKARFLALIDREIDVATDFAAGRCPVGGRVVAKFNSMEDPAVTEKLYQASQAGVDVTLFIRGFCCLRPGLPGLSENIRVVSILGRFLEHSRIFHFGAGRADPLEGDWYIGSADWMYRNLNNRVEAITPVRTRENRAKLQRIIDVMNADRRRAWDLAPDGFYTRRSPAEDAEPDSPEAVGTFEVLMREARSGGVRV